MPGAGTDKTRNWVEAAGPVIILVEPQLGENIGAAARVMANFGLGRLRLVKPRDGWPNTQAQRSASGADRILDEAALFDDLTAAIADCTVVLATTARAHDQAKPVLGPDQAASFLAPHVAAGENVAVLFGRERYGLENHEVALADRIVTFPVNPAFASLNLAQAVALIAYEWFKLASGGVLPFTMPRKSEPAGKEQVQAFFVNLERRIIEVHTADAALRPKQSFVAIDWKIGSASHWEAVWLRSWARSSHLVAARASRTASPAPASRRTQATCARAPPSRFPRTGSSGWSARPRR